MLSAAPTLRRGLRLAAAPERWQSGRSRRTRNAEYAQAYRGFESLPLRHVFAMVQRQSAWAGAGMGCCFGSGSERLGCTLTPTKS